MSLIDSGTEAKLEELIRNAGQVLVDMWPGGNGSRRGELERFTKEDGTIVTTADLEANNLLVSGLTDLFPDTMVMSEELPESHGGTNSNNLWILDPLDGTKHYSAGKGNFSILLSLTEKGRVTYGAMYLPVAGQFFSARAGRGTLLNGEYMRVSDSDGPRPQSIFIEHFDMPPSNWWVSRKIDSSEAFAGLCTGQLDGVVIKLTTHKSWDIAPFVVLVEEAGGRVTDETGAVPLFESKPPGIAYLIASNGIIHEELLRVVNPQG